MTFQELLNEKLYYIGFINTERTPYLFYHEYFCVYTSYELAEADFEDLKSTYMLFEIQNNEVFFKKASAAGYLRYAINGEGDIYELPSPEENEVSSAPSEEEFPSASAEKNPEPVSPAYAAQEASSAPEPKQEETPSEPKQEETPSEPNPEIQSDEASVGKKGRPIVATLHFLLVAFAGFLLLGGVSSGDLFSIPSVAPMGILHFYFGRLSLNNYIRAPFSSLLAPILLSLFILSEFLEPSLEMILILVLSLILFINFICHNKEILKKKK